MYISTYVQWLFPTYFFSMQNKVNVFVVKVGRTCLIPRRLNGKKVEFQEKSTRYADLVYFEYKGLNDVFNMNSYHFFVAMVCFHSYEKTTIVPLTKFGYNSI